MKANSFLSELDFENSILFQQAGDGDNGGGSGENPRVCSNCKSPNCPTFSGGTSCSQLPYESGKSYIYYDKDALYDDLDEHTYNSKHRDYVEVGYVHNVDDDTYTVYRDKRNTYEKTYMTIYEKDGDYYYYGKLIDSYTHTHRDDPEATNPEDYDMKDTYPGLNVNTYYHRGEYPIGDRPPEEDNPYETQGYSSEKLKI